LSFKSYITIIYFTIYKDLEKYLSWMRIAKFLGKFCENFFFTRHFSFLDYQEYIQTSILELSGGVDVTTEGKIGSYYEVAHTNNASYNITVISETWL